MAWGTTAPPSADLKDRSAPSSHGWTPTIQDPLAKAFPWASLTVFGSPLPNVSTSFVRQQLQARRGSRRPKWPQQPGSTLDDAAWKGIWTLLRRLPLSAIVRTTSVLILNKNVWTYHDKEGDGNRRCPAGCGGEDGVNHGYFECPGAVAVWEECLPLLTALGCPTPTNFSASGILRCDGVPPPMRPRFGLWMAVVLHMLYICRHQVASSARAHNLSIHFDHITDFDVLSNTTGILADLLASAWERVLKASASHRPHAISNFNKIWVCGGSFLRFDDDKLFFSAVSTRPLSSATTEAGL